MKEQLLYGLAFPVSFSNSTCDEEGASTVDRMGISPKEPRSKARNYNEPNFYAILFKSSSERHDLFGHAFSACKGFPLIRQRRKHCKNRSTDFGQNQSDGPKIYVRPEKSERACSCL